MNHKELQRISERCAWAAAEGNLESVKHYIASGANPHWDGEHALRYAAGKGQTHIVKYLLNEHNANPEPIDYHSLRWACDLNHPNSLDCVKLLYEACKNKPPAALLWFTYRYETKYEKLVELTRYFMNQDPDFFPYLIAKENESHWTAPNNPYYQELKNEYLTLKEKDMLVENIQAIQHPTSSQLFKI